MVYVVFKIQILHAWIMAIECKKCAKEYRDDTVEIVNGYLAYRRRNNGRVVQVGGLVPDNRYVVAYNSFLLRK